MSTIDPTKQTRWHKAPPQSDIDPVYTLRWRTASLIPTGWMLTVIALCLVMIIAAVSFRATLRDIPVAYSPDSDQLIQTTSVRLASDSQLRDFGEFACTLGESWTWKTVAKTGERMENYIQTTMRETARKRYTEFAAYAKERYIGRIASPAGSSIRSKTAETAVIVVPYTRHEFTVLDMGKQVYHGGTQRVLVLTVMQDLANDANITGVYIRQREDFTRDEYAAMYPDPFGDTPTIKAEKR